ncbi:MAG TPA: hypothetical protein DCO79_10990 [Spirochaeta sp.]|nr:hypothetical protein [Spirochaeta sp.]
MEFSNYPKLTPNGPALQRKGGLLDATFFGVMNNALPVSIWMTLSGFAWFPGGNILVANILTFVLILFGYALVWGILAGTMPRSGGSYVYNSRIFHPMLAMIISFWNGAFIMLAWICVLAPWFWQVGVPMLAGITGSEENAFSFFNNGWGLYLGTSLVNISAFLTALLGMRHYFKIQRALVAISLIAVTVVGIIFSRTSHQDFISIWDSFVSGGSALRFSEMVEFAGTEMGGIPDSWNWKNTLGLMLPVSWGMIYGYAVIFIAGEIKNPRVNILQSQILTTLISGFFMFWIGLEYSRMLGWEGMHALAWIAEKGGDNINVPFRLHYINLAAMISGFQKGIGILLGFAFIASNWLWVVFSYIAWSRAAMAWGKDGIGPRWFNTNKTREGQPVLLLLVLLVLSQLALLYFSVYTEVQHSLSVGVMQLLSVFAFTAFAAIILPFSKKLRTIWNLSPYRHWTLGKIPIVTIAGILSLLLTTLLLIGFFVNDEFEELRTWWVVINIAVWIAGGLWYYIWKQIQSRRGVDLSKSFNRMPPE